MTPYKNSAELVLKMWAYRNNVSFSELVKKTGVSYGGLKKWLNREDRNTGIVANALARTIGMRFEDLMDEYGNIDPGEQFINKRCNGRSGKPGKGPSNFLENTIGHVIYNYIDAHNMTLKEFASLLGVKTANIVHWTQYKTRIPQNVITKLKKLDPCFEHVLAYIVYMPENQIIDALLTKLVKNGHSQGDLEVECKRLKKYSYIKPYLEELYHATSKRNMNGRSLKDVLKEIDLDTLE